MKRTSNFLILILALALLPCRSFADVDLRSLEESGRKELNEAIEWFQKLNSEKLILTAQYYAEKAILSSMELSEKSLNPEVKQQGQRVIFVASEILNIMGVVDTSKKFMNYVWTPSPSTMNWLVEARTREANLRIARDKFLRGPIKDSAANKEAFLAAQEAAADQAFYAQRPFALSRLAATGRFLTSTSFFLAGVPLYAYVSSSIAYFTLEQEDFEALKTNLTKSVTQLARNLNLPDSVQTSDGVQP